MGYFLGARIPQSRARNITEIAAARSLSG